MYIAYFEININEDDDFHFEKYKGFNHDHVLYQDKEIAHLAVCNHLRIASETVGSHFKSSEDKQIKRIKDWIYKNYLIALKWDFNKYPNLYMHDEYGNAKLEYIIGEVKYFDGRELKSSDKISIETNKISFEIIGTTEN